MHEHAPLCPPPPGEGETQPESWASALRRTLGVPVIWIPRQAGAVGLGCGPACRLLDTWTIERPPCRNAHDAIRAETPTSTHQRTDCPLGATLLASPVWAEGRSLGWLECGPVPTTEATHSGAEQTLRAWSVPGVLRQPILDHLRSGPARSPDEIDGLSDLLANAARALSRTTPAAGSATLLPAAVRVSIEHLDRRLAEPITVSELARVAGLSADRFGRIFKQATGKTVPDYINEKRIAKARELLALTRWRISEISFACGFQSIPHFNRTFRRWVGHSPSQERQLLDTPRTDQPPHRHGPEKDCPV